MNMTEQIEDTLRVANGLIVAICQVLAMLVISIGITKALGIYLKDVLTPGRTRESINASRLEIGQSFSLGLSFLIGASILKTTLAPTWTDIGQLAAIIAIRTVLNYFLLHDIRVHSSHDQQGSRSAFATILKGPKARSDTDTNPNKQPDEETP